MISACVLGYSPIAMEFISRFKALPYYKKRNSDTEGVRIHTLYVNDPDLLSRDYVHRYEGRNGFSNVLADGTQESNKESSVGNDTEWLLSSDGHDVIVEATNSDESYLDTLIALAKRGYWVILTSDVYKTTFLDTLLTASADGSGRVSSYESMDSLFEELGTVYTSRLTQHRKVLYEESLTAKPCGLPD